MDRDLHTALWNAWTACQLFAVRQLEQGEFTVGRIIAFAWERHFKRPSDGERYEAKYAAFRNELLAGTWSDTYDLIECALEAVDDTTLRELLVAAFNNALERERAAYRIVADQVTPITSEVAASAIQTAIEETSKLGTVRAHLAAALELFSRRKDPDYRNSIKESISAVESLCKLLAKSPSATLGDALDRLEKAGVSIHPAQKKAFSAIYGWTNDAQGIRHGLKDEVLPEQEDALYMLEVCSAFVSYLLAKAARAGIKVQ